MIIQPKTRGFICTTAHPAGCAKNVQNQIALAKKHPTNLTKKTLVLGASTGYGLASMITATFGCCAKTIGVSFDRPAVPDKGRTATAGWYNLAAFAEAADQAGLEQHIVIGDAFATKTKDKVVELIRQTVGKVDMVVYSLASPVRTDPNTNVRYQSSIKPIGEPLVSKTIDMKTWKTAEAVLQPATEEEIESTIKVMGGEDWQLWIDVLREADVLEDNALTVAYSYIGPTITHAIYKDGTIGMAKNHLQQTADNLNKNGRAYISVNKAVVTQASAAIPAVPLYISILFRVMKEHGLHEDCIEQMIRMFEKLDCGELALDEERRIRMDDWEMREDIQQEAINRWEAANENNIGDLADIDGYQKDFLKLFGFGLVGVDESADVNIDVSIPGAIVIG